MVEWIRGDEEWRPLDIAPGYEISSHGRVRNAKSGHIKKLAYRRGKGRLPYLRASVWSEGRVRHVTVHTAVLRVFVGPPPDDKPYGCHNDGDPGNNKLDNLRWDSQSENCLDKRVHGTMRLGSLHHSARLTEALVVTIREEEQGTPLSAIARKFGIAKSTAYAVLARRTWKHV